MTGPRVDIRAQWALHGKRADDENYGILACSQGSLSRNNFTEAISRFELGEIDTLPQVSVSYARLRDNSKASYLAMAFVEFASDNRRAAFDRQGMQITYTSYFCLPYRRLAELAIGYLSTYQALRVLTLPGVDGPPVRVSLALPAMRMLTIDPLAMRVAALMLTDKPVCVLGADDVSTEERLRFIDAVMDLLPYGLRARMAAATWTRPTNVGHRFRLFFSRAPRPGSEDDHLVTWDQPDKALIPGGPAAEYLGWLEDTLGELARLTEATTEMRFGSKTGSQVLDLAIPDDLPPALARSAALTGPFARVEPDVPSSDEDTKIFRV